MQLFSFLEIKLQNAAHLKKGYFDLMLPIFSHQEKDTQIPSANTPLAYTYFAYPIDFFCVPNFAKIVNLSCMVSLWCDSWC